MSLDDARNDDLPEFSITFNMRLMFVKTNDHNAKLYQDPINHWVVKVKDTLIVFDAMPWVNYQGELYMGQLGECYIVIMKPKNVDKWGIIVKRKKVEEPPFEDAIKLLNTVKGQLIRMDDPNIALYV